MGQLREIEDELAELGYQIIAISPDRPEKVADVVAKSDASYTLVSDSKLRTAHALGVAFVADQKTIELYRGYGIDLEQASGESHHQLPVPSVFIVDTSRTIRFSYVDPNYKQRIPPAVLLAAAEAFKE